MRKSDPTARLARTIQKYFSPKNIFTKEDRQFHLNWWQILCLILLGFILCLLLDRTGRFDLSRPIAALLGSLFIAIRLRWRLRGRIWFWITILIFVVVSAALTFLMTWSTEGPSRPIIGGLMTISVYFLFVVFHAFDIRSRKTSTTTAKRPRSTQGQRSQP